MEPTCLPGKSCLEVQNSWSLDLGYIVIKVPSSPFCLHDPKAVVVINHHTWLLKELPWWLSGKESACQCRRLWFDPWVRKIP